MEMNENDLILDPELVVKIEAVELTTPELQEKIKALATTSEGEDLKYAMRDLKKALLSNPSACALLLPEDIGEMVKYLKIMIGPDLAKIETSKAKKEAKEKAPKLIKLTDFSVEELKGLSDDDFI